MSEIQHNETSAYIPAANPQFVPFDYYESLKKIVEQGLFMPIYIIGVSSFGKTTFVEQACAETGRPFVKINLSGATTETQLIGSHRIKDGNMTFHYGPVIEAMKQGAILFMDEGDQAKPQISMVLQSVMEGKPYYIKETGEVVYPAPGFNVILAANTKGRGDVTGMYMGAQIQNWAFLERFAITFEHGFPERKDERKILNARIQSYGRKFNDPFMSHVVDTALDLADKVRTNFNNRDSDDLLTTRRLLFFLDTLMIFGDKRRAWELTLARFEDATKSAWLDMLDKIDIYRGLNTEEEFLQQYKQREAEEKARREEEKQRSAQQFESDDDETSW